MMSTTPNCSSIHDLSQRYGLAHDEADIGAIQTEIERELAAMPGHQLFSILVMAAEGDLPGLCRSSD